MVYLLALDGVSSGIVTLACKRFIQGQVEGASLTFRPTAAEVAAECRRLQDKAYESERNQERLEGPRKVPERLPKPPFIPYPKLWNELHGEPALRDTLKAMTFDGITDISKTMGTEGIDAAKTRLRRIAATSDSKMAAA